MKLQNYDIKINFQAVVEKGGDFLHFCLALQVPALGSSLWALVTALESCSWWLRSHLHQEYLLWFGSVITFHSTQGCPLLCASWSKIKQAVKDTSDPSTRIKPTIGFVSLVSGPSLLIKFQDLLGLPDAGRAQAHSFPWQGITSSCKYHSFPRQRFYPWTASIGHCLCLTNHWWLCQKKGCYQVLFLSESCNPWQCQTGINMNQGESI